MKVQAVHVDKLVLDPRNARTHPARNLDAIRSSLQTYGQVVPILVRRETMVVIGGNGTLTALREMGAETVSVVYADGLSDAQAADLALRLNRSAELAEWDDDRLRQILAELAEADVDLSSVGWTEEEYAALSGTDASSTTTKRPTLADRFVVPPFTVLDTRQGYWIERRREWLDLGIQSEIGRGKTVPKPKGGKASRREADRRSNLNEETRKPSWATGGMENRAPGTSIFDPVLAEALYRWFLPPAPASILDPFAGGSVRGIVAGLLGYNYTGIDLRAEQVEANEAQRYAMIDDRKPHGWPKWIAGDAAQLDDLLPEEERFDFVFTCPPYGDLEVYSDDPRDLSTMPPARFFKAFRKVIAQACARLRDNRFAAIVISDWRGKDGLYNSFRRETVAAFEAAGLHLYNEAVLVNQAGTLPIRVAKLMTARKLGRTHQDVIVFWKGDPKTIADTFGRLDLSAMEAEKDRENV